MITKSEVEFAKKLWEQARQSAALAHESWGLFVKFHNTLLDSSQAIGFPFTEATKEIEHLIEEHSKRYKSALEHMDNMEKTYGELLEKFKSAST
jgi:hypothetical protein